MKRKRGSPIRIGYKGAYVETESKTVFFFLAFMVASMFTGWLASQSSTNPLALSIFLATMILFIGYSLYSFYICKSRIPTRRRCNRCKGLAVGTFVSVLIAVPLIALIIKGTPPHLDDFWACVLFFVGIVMLLPAILHGVFHRYYAKRLTIGDTATSFVSGILLGLGTLLEGIAMFYLL